MNAVIRKPKQQRAIEKKQKIIDAGFNLICKNGYYRTNIPEIAKKAGVSTGIIYQYFKDKHDIFLKAIEKYGDSIFFPMLQVDKKRFSRKNFRNTMRDFISQYIKSHKVSKIAHREIMSMVHSDPDIERYYYNRELQLTKMIKSILLQNDFSSRNLYERVHIMVGMIDNLCHEIIYHRHKDMDYDVMIDIVIKNILNLFL